MGRLNVIELYDHAKSNIEGFKMDIKEKGNLILIYIDDEQVWDAQGRDAMPNAEAFLYGLVIGAKHAEAIK